VRDSTDAELPTKARIIEAARIRAEHSLAYADAFAAATAIAHDAVSVDGRSTLLMTRTPVAF
jgi:hypothetical protein